VDEPQSAKRKPHGAKAKAREYSFEVVDRCEDLYVQEERTFEDIAKETGVSAVQVQRWASKYEWKDKKKEFKARLFKAQEESRAIMREEILLQDLTHQRDLLKSYFDNRKILDKGDIQAMYAYTNVTDSICKILADMRKRDEALRGTQKIDRPQVFVDFLKDLVAWLKEHDAEALVALEKNFDEFITFAKQKYV
jgi:transposase-like protein